MNYDNNRCAVCLSVRELCDYAFRHGDLSGKPTDFERLHEGSEIHRKLQSERRNNYHAEVTLSNTSKLGDITYSVSGRADGIISDGDGYIIEEIKTVSSIPSRSFVRDTDLAQLKCYGYFLASQKALAQVTLRLTYYELENNEEHHTDKIYTFDELKFFYIGMLQSISKRGQLLTDRANRILPNAKNAVFPYSELRECQSDLIRECYTDLKQGDRLFAEAPTGIGKTVSTIYPAVRVLGCGKCDKIFYLTAKASIRREVNATCERIRQAGTGIRSIVLNAKEQMCFCNANKTEHFCEPEFCQYAKGYYDRVDGAIFNLIDRQSGYTRDDIIEAAKKYSVCPYELSLDLSELCDVIICDYNYVFSPIVYLKRYFDQILGFKNQKYSFLIDEAHNLPERARNMYSASIKMSDVSTAYNVEPYVDPDTGEVVMPDRELCEAIDKLAFEIGQLEHLCDGEITSFDDGTRYAYAVSHESFDSLFGAAEYFRKLAAGWLKRNRDSIFYPSVDKLASTVYEYTSVASFFDNSFISFVNVCGGDTEVGIFCLDPSNIMDKLLDRAYSAVLFSATLTPSDYYADVLGNSQKSVQVSFPSPFPQENFCVTIADFVSTRYSDREKSVKAIATCIAATVSPKAGNYIVYFPSYKYMEDVYKNFTLRFPKVKTVVQAKNMTGVEKESFLDFFRDDENKLRIGFCVLGGSFSEGVDLPGSRLIGSIIVGVGLPGLSNEKNIIKEYYDGKNGMGYEYAYTYPGFNNVMQAVGRVIRTDTDRGIAVLIDDRYTTQKYSCMFPKFWGQIKIAGNPSSLAEIVKEFWK